MTVSPLQRRILDLTPGLDHGLEVFLRLLRIEETEAVPSAAVPLGGAPRLRINPNFVREHCPDDEDLLGLVLHEIHHVLLGHTRLYRRVDAVTNIAFDAVINAMICRRWPDPARTAFFRRLNRADAAPGCLLRPPEGFPGPPRWPAGLDPRLREVVEDLYYTNTGTFHEVWEAIVQRLPRVLILAASGGSGSGLPGAGGANAEVGDEGEGAGREGEDGAGGAVLIGNHEADERGLEAGDDPALFDAVRRVVERWPQPPDPRVGRSLAGAMGKMSVQPSLTVNARALRRAILAAARPGDLRRGRPEPRPQAVQGGVPGRDRRAFAWRAAGGQPLLYARRLAGRPRRAGIRRVAVYVDVSGSVSDVIPDLIGALRAVRGLVDPKVHVFSTEVVPTSLRELLAGRFETSGGTDGSAVTAHIHRTRPEAAVVLTDGYVGPIPEAHLDACRRARLQVVLTPDGWRDDLEPAAVGFHQLELP